MLIKSGMCVASLKSCFFFLLPYDTIQYQQTVTGMRTVCSLKGSNFHKWTISLLDHKLSTDLLEYYRVRWVQKWEKHEDKTVFTHHKTIETEKNFFSSLICTALIYLVIFSVLSRKEVKSHLISVMNKSKN